MPAVGYVRLDILPGQNLRATLTGPVRFVMCLFKFIYQYPGVLFRAMRRAVSLRLTLGPPSKILTLGGGKDFLHKHTPDAIFMCAAVHDQPLDEAKLRAAWASLVNDSPGMEPEKTEVIFEADKPVEEWPATGSFNPISLNPTIDQTKNMYEEWGRLGNPNAYVRRLRVFNGPPGKPTVCHFQGSIFPWDGSSNFNWYKELMSRYAGKPPNDVCQSPPIDPSSAAKFDAGSFSWYLLKMPYNIARNLVGSLWVAHRAEVWAGGNGVGAKITAMNFTKEESAKLYKGAKKLGASPFSAFNYAAVKACKQVLGHGPTTIAQQASLQTRHFPCEANASGKRDLVGDWLIGPVQDVPIFGAYDLATAHKGYESFLDDLKNVGPRTRNAFMAKAYGEYNGGAACFETTPGYNDAPHLMHRCLFFNTYGVRTTEEAAHLTQWLWNAPLWLGVNTININGATTTLVGSSFWGLEVVEALRDSMEATLREIMSAA